MSLALLADAPCAQCGALFDEGQRYCVHCGSRRSEVEDPAIAWMANVRSKRGSAAFAAATAPAPAAPQRNPLAIPALSLALLPVAVAIGALVAHRGGNDQQQLLDALRNQKAPVVNVGSSAGTVAAAKTIHIKAKRAKVGKADSTGATVAATTKYGVAHTIAGYKPTAQKVQSDKKLVQKINNSIGKNYLDAQKNLPDTIVVSPGSGNTTSPGATGRGD